MVFSSSLKLILGYLPMEDVTLASLTEAPSDFRFSGSFMMSELLLTFLYRGRGLLIRGPVRANLALSSVVPSPRHLL